MRTVRLLVGQDGDEEPVDVEVDADPVCIMEVAIAESTDIPRHDLTYLSTTTLSELFLQVLDDGFEEIDVPTADDPE